MTTKAKLALGAREIEIDGERYEVKHVRDMDGEMAEIECDGADFILAKDTATAGAAARERWADMAKNDPKEFRCVVGDETLVKWALGEMAGPGSTWVASLEEWLDLHLDVPEEEFASYDSQERDVNACGVELTEELGWTPGVAYRSN